MTQPTNEQIANWYPRLFRKALRLTGRTDVAADMTQETFCRALRSWESFNGDALPTTWLHYILINVVRDWHRGQRRRQHAALDEWATEPVDDDSPGPPDRVERREEFLRLRQAVAGLSNTLRPAFVATVLDGHTYEEAAELLSIPPGTVASRVHEARRHLQAALHRAFPEARP